jgi:hypothetical protein
LRYVPKLVAGFIFLDQKRNICKVLIYNIYMDKACSTHGEKRNAYRNLVGKPGGNKPLGTPRCRWKYNIKIDRTEIG